MRYQDEQEAIRAAVATFPETFGLRAYPGSIFRLEPRSSFLSESSGLQLVLQRKMSEEESKKYRMDSGFYDFTRDTPENIRGAMVYLCQTCGRRLTAGDRTLGRCPDGHEIPEETWR